jgi:hypothetical protein
MAGAGGYHLYNASSHRITNLFVRDCEFYGNSSVHLVGYTNTGVWFDNNLFFRTPVTASLSSGLNWLGFSNNLALGSTLRFGSGASSNLWTLYNNAFDNCRFLMTNNLTLNGYNAYINCSNRLHPVIAGDLTPGSFAYASGPLGDFYHASTDLTDAGSRPAWQAGLHHYTTQTNQVLELASIVDLGYHYVPLDANGLPYDSDGDGLPDAWERYWFGDLAQSAGDDPDGDGLSNRVEWLAGTNPLVSDLAFPPSNLNINFCSE